MPIYLYRYSPTFPRSPHYSRVIYHFVGRGLYSLLISVSVICCLPSRHSRFHFAIVLNFVAAQDSSSPLQTVDNRSVDKLR